MSVTIVSCLYGDRSYERFIGDWAESIANLNTRPQEIIVGTDKNAFQRGAHIPHTRVVISPCEWRHPQAFYQHLAIMACRTEWVWILDLDDVAHPDALDGLEEVEADAWIMGFFRTDGERHIPPQLTPTEFLACPGNPFTGASAIRTEAYREVGGYPDVAFQDYGLWRRMALVGMRFQASDRAHFTYRLHDDARTNVELQPEKRPLHLVEMLEKEYA